MAIKKKEETSSVVIFFEGSKQRLKELMFGAHKESLDLIKVELMNQVINDTEDIDLDTIEIIMNAYKLEKIHYSNVIDEIDNIPNMEQLIIWLLKSEWYGFLGNDICHLLKFITLETTSFRLE